MTTHLANLRESCPYWSEFHLFYIQSTGLKSRYVNNLLDHRNALFQLNNRIPLVRSISELPSRHLSYHLTDGSIRTYKHTYIHTDSLTKWAGHSGASLVTFMSTFVSATLAPPPPSTLSHLFQFQTDRACTNNPWGLIFSPEVWFWSSSVDFSRFEKFDFYEQVPGSIIVWKWFDM